MNLYLPYFFPEVIYISTKKKDNKTLREKKFTWFIGVKEEIKPGENRVENEFIEKLKNSIPVTREKVKNFFFKDLTLIQNQVKESSNPEYPVNVLFFGVAPGELNIDDLKNYYQSQYSEGINYLLAEDISVVMNDAMKKKKLWQEMKRLF